VIIPLEMYRPECPYTGPQTPVPSSHLTLRFSIPEKCDGCRFNFEGRCKLITNRLVRLDYGYCGIPGPTHLVPDPRARRKIPAKCSTCTFLGEDDIFRLVCRKDSDVWGDVPRGLDYTGESDVADQERHDEVRTNGGDGTADSP